MSQPEHEPEIEKQSPAESMPAPEPVHLRESSSEYDEIIPATDVVESAPGELQTPSSQEVMSTAVAAEPSPHESDTDLPGILQSRAVTIVIAVFVITS